MDLIEVLQQINQSSMDAYGLSDLAIGTVTKAVPLEVTLRESMAPLPQEVLHLTAAVIEKKIPVLAHEHTTSGLRHNHSVSTTDDDYETSDGLTPDAYLTDQQLKDIVCYEDGKPLPRKWLHYPEPRTCRRRQGTPVALHARAAVHYSIPHF